MLLTVKSQSFQDERSFRSYTGVGWDLYVYLRKSFEQEWLMFHQSVTKPDKDRKRIRGGGRKAKLPSIDDKLVFILHYFKAYPTMDALSTNFGMSRSSACGLVHLLARILQKSLANLEVIPLRQLTDKEEFLEYLKQLGDIETLLIDATERAHRRVQDKDKRRALYSGKKRFTMKNTIISTLKRWIVFLGLTTQGSLHDYELLKEELDWYQGKNDWFEQLEILIDLGYLGFDKDFEALKTNLPHKKPKKSKNNCNL